MHQNFRIRVIRLEHVPLGFELLPQLAVVVNTPIKHDRNQRQIRLDLARDDRRLSRLVGQVGAEALTVMDHGLVAAGVVEDAEASVDEGDVDGGAVLAHGSVTEASLPVGPAVFDRFIQNIKPLFGYGFQRRRGCAILRVVDSDDASDAAHGQSVVNPISRCRVWSGRSRRTRGCNGRCKCLISSPRRCGVSA